MLNTLEKLMKKENLLDMAEEVIVRSNMLAINILLSIIHPLFWPTICTQNSNLCSCTIYAHLGIIKLERQRTANETTFLDWIEPQRSQAIS